MESDKQRKSSCRPRSLAGERERKAEASGVARKVRNRDLHSMCELGLVIRPASCSCCSPILTEKGAGSGQSAACSRDEQERQLVGAQRYARLVTQRQKQIVASQRGAEAGKAC